MGLALLAVLLSALPAAAHANLSVAAPPGGILATAPAAIDLSFSEPVTPAGRGIAVWSPSGRQVAHHLDRLGRDRLRVGVDVVEPGTYLVVWTVIAADTHPSRGSYTFSFQRPGPLPEIGRLPEGDVGAVSPLGLLLQVLARWLHFAGVALGFGTIAVLLLLRIDSRRVERLALGGVLLLIAAEPVGVAGQVLSLGPPEGQVLADVLGSPAGRIVSLRVGAGLLLWSLLGVARQRRRAAYFAIIGLGAALAVVDAGAGHAVRGVAEPLALALGAVHLAAMAFWVGGVAALAASFRGEPGNARRRLLAAFEQPVTLSVAVLFLSGLVLAVSHLGSAADLVATAYGRVVLLKGVGAGAALGAAYHGLRAGRSWRLEAAALAGILVLAGLLVSLPPPR